MKKQILISVVVGGMAFASMGAAVAADQVRTQDKLHSPAMTPLQDKDKLQDQDRLQDRDQIYLGTLMTPEERAAYLERLRLAKTEQERVAIRAEHRIQMEAVAREKGLALPASGNGNGAANSSSGSSGSSAASGASNSGSTGGASSGNKGSSSSGGSNGKK